MIEARGTVTGNSRMAGMAFSARLGRFHTCPSDAARIDQPLAQAERRTIRLRGLCASAARDAWDGGVVLREAVAKHGGVALSRRDRHALVYPVSMLIGGELGAWMVATELAERLEDPDARAAASIQVFDEARHVRVLRDYVALLQVPEPTLDAYFALGARRLLTARGSTLELLTLQLVAEGIAQEVFGFLADAAIEPVLTEILPFFVRDEARHVELGTLQLPQRLAKLSTPQAARLASRAGAVADAFLMTQVRHQDHYRTLGLDPRELARRIDRVLAELSRRLGNVPGGEQPFLRAGELSDPANSARVDALFARSGTRERGKGGALRRLLDATWWPQPCAKPVARRL